MKSARYGIAAIVLCGIVVLIAGMEVSGWTTEAAVLSARQELVSAQLLELRNLQDGFFDLEGGQRGYLLTGDESYLHSFADGRRSFALALGRLHKLFERDPPVLGEIDALAALGQGRVAQAEESIELRRKSGLAAVLADPQQRQNALTMTHFRDMMKALIARLDRDRSTVIAAEVARYRKISTLGLDVNALVLLLVVVGIGFMSLSIHRLEQLQRYREQEAMHDALTGLPNRRYLSEWLGVALSGAKRTGRPLTLLFFDLDGFKGVNDRLGHEAGDRVLRSIGERLRQAMRKSDFVARLGGDEFVAGLPDAPPPALSILIDRLQRLIAAAPIPELDDGAVSASIGVAWFPGDGEDAAELIAAADRAMYEVKESRRAARIATGAQTPVRAA
ncbi:MAG TPA: diguanylate cyclase [Stellaceae bacterium]|nr:diguanylate cyclase [Stellaceae bacterium]